MFAKPTLEKFSGGYILKQFFVKKSKHLFCLAKIFSGTASHRILKTRIFKIEKTEAKQRSRHHFFRVYFPHLIVGSAEDTL